MQKRIYVKLLIIFILLLAWTIIAPLKVKANEARYTTFASSGDTHEQADEIRVLFGRDFSKTPNYNDYHEEKVLIQVMKQDEHSKAYTKAEVLKQNGGYDKQNYGRINFYYTVPEAEYIASKCKTVRFKIAIKWEYLMHTSLVGNKKMDVGINNSSNEIIRNRSGYNKRDVYG